MAVTRKRKSAAAGKRYMVIAEGEYYCNTTVYTSLTEAVAKATEMFESDEVPTYVLEVVKTVKRGKPEVVEGYMEN